MACATEPICLLVLLLLGLPPLTSTEDPVPAAWPHQFHSEQFVNKCGTLWKVDLSYDWPNGRNLNIIQYQLGDPLYDLEWNNGTSFYYTLEPFEKTCRVMHFDVGIVRPNWVDGANYLGQEYVDNFLCNVWEKVDFLWYYEDVLTQRPAKWIFFDGMITHVMTFEAGAVLEDANWQAPVYCFSEAESEAEKNGSSHLLETAVHVGSHGTLMREREPIMQVLCN